MLTVAHYKETPIAWAPDALVQCINKYSDRYRAVLISPNENEFYGGDRSNSIPRKDIPILKDTNFNKYSIVHFHNKFLKTTKPQVIQYHSVGQVTQLEFPYTKLVIAQFHATLPEYKNCLWVRNIIDLDDELYKYVDKSTNIRIAFSPSTLLPRGNRTYSSKAVPETKQILDNMVRKFNNVEIDIISNTSFEMCMRRKSVCVIHIDECVTKSYHRCTLEGLAQGAVTICSMDDEVESIFKKVSGSDMLPVDNVWLDDLEGHLNGLVGLGRKNLIHRGKKNKEWMRKYWNPKDIVAEYEKIYDNILKQGEN